jgi:phage tail-like protein
MCAAQPTQPKRFDLYRVGIGYGPKRTSQVAPKADILPARRNVNSEVDTPVRENSKRWMGHEVRERQMPQRKSNPYSAFNFTIKFGDELVGGFEEIEGLSAPDATARALMPGRSKQTNITLKRGVIRSDIFRLWSSAPEKGRPVPRILKVIAHDKAIQQWVFTSVFPNKVTGPNLKSEGNDISVETIEITAEGVAVQKECDH